MVWFALASLTPAALLAAGGLWGGPWPYAALIYVTAFVLCLDRLSHAALPLREDAAGARAATRLAVALGAVHFLLLPAGVWMLAAAPGSGPGARLAGAVALGMFLGQISNSAAHELIHKPARIPRLLGKAIYVSLLFGHHGSAHPRVHHVWVASDRDPNSARPGEAFYRFWPRAWIGSFREGLRAENRLRRRRAPPPPVLSHPYIAYGAGAALTLAVAAALAGGRGVAVLLALAGYAQMQLLLADYVQHYGLRRKIAENGTPEPAGPQHSWNAAPWFSAAMMLNAPRHSDHHQHPLRAFPALRLDGASMPMLPYPFPVMAALALVPPLWRRLMDPRAARWRSRTAAAGVADGNLAPSKHEPNDADSPVPARADGNRRAGGRPDPDERRGI